MKYAMISYTYDINQVPILPLKIQNQYEFMQAYILLYNELTDKIYKARFNQLDNETSQN